MGKRLVHYQYTPQTNRHEARCPGCTKLVGWVSDEALYLYPDQAHIPLVAVHNCPCTCSTDPYNCPVGQALAQAILARKTAQGDAHVRLA